MYFFALMIKNAGLECRLLITPAEKRVRDLPYLLIIFNLLIALII
ncbi:hypothetical protein DB43_HD00010 [Parachlamydia acanthamoebae]|uniref:Uncharacterized protein n=1 Tax=Parachlamydia acanthamoebae TaxID=83552 RepID=A0A0C1C6U3_9BACT|nr:hypothetical protein DB43_HD00010 [Parachlamydia acanthamoebae]